MVIRGPSVFGSGFIFLDPDVTSGIFTFIFDSIRFLMLFFSALRCCINLYTLKQEDYWVMVWEYLTDSCKA